jgi:hypothetical protein
VRGWLALALICAGIVDAPSALGQDQVATSDDEAKIAAARDLMELFGYERQLDFMFEKLSPLFSQGVIGILQGDPATKAMTDQLIATGKGGQGRLVAILDEEFKKAIKAQYPKMKDSAARQYAASFTLEELLAITAFYETPAGAKSLSVLPELQAKLGKAGEEFGRIAGAQAGRKGFERAINEMLPQSGKAKL